MTDFQFQPTAGPGRPRSSFSGVARLVGRLITLACVGAAGVAGWFGVDELALAEDNGRPVAVTLPELGGGLPTAQLVEPQPWRVFQLTYSQDGRDEQYWFDLDRWMIRTQIDHGEGSDEIEIRGDRGFRRGPNDDDWVEQDEPTTRAIASFVMGGIGPFLLTDLVPPDALGFTSLELEGTSKGVRVYEVGIDSVTLREQHPLLHQRWVESTRIIGDGSPLFRIRVREDGYVVRIDGENAAVAWTELSGGIAFQSPLAIPTGPFEPQPPYPTPVGPDGQPVPNGDGAPPGTEPADGTAPSAPVPPPAPAGTEPVTPRPEVLDAPAVDSTRLDANQPGLVAPVDDASHD